MLDNNFWLGRWQRGETGWHLPRVHPKLISHWPALQLAPDTSVFVPLCGKSLDLLWLAQQQKQVVACELSELAVQEFFEQAKMSPIKSQVGELLLYRCNNLSIWVGDFFSLRPEHLDNVSAVYDRAALIALPPQLRQHYVEHMFTLLPQASMLLVTLAYEQSQMNGPPFSVQSDEVSQLFSAATKINMIVDHEIIEDEPRFAARGLSSLREQVYTLKW